MNMKENGKDKDFIKTIKEYIDTHYADKQISIDFLSELTGYSIMRINDVYKKRYGLTPMEYLSEKRIEQVKILIEAGMPLGKAANDVGYGSIRTFYRVFKDKTGMSPEKYKTRNFNNYELFKGIIEMKDMRPLVYARKKCDAIMLANEPRKLKPFDIVADMGLYSYHQGLFLSGMYQIFDMCGEKKYFNYIKEWVDSVIDDNGNVKIHEHMIGSLDWLSVRCLDFRQPSRILFPLYEETGDERYLKLIEHSIESLLDYPTTTEGLFWHRRTIPGVVQLEGAYMTIPVICMYAKLKNKPEYYDIAVFQAEKMYETHFDKESGLLRHGRDENKKMEWADSVTGLSEFVWGRAMGYYVAAVAELIEYMPEAHPKRDRIIEIELSLLDALIRYQNETGRWYQIIDKVDYECNWLENSASCFIVYALAKAVKLGIAGDQYARAAIRGYVGVIDIISYGESEEMLLNDICMRSSVSSDISFYFNMMRETNNLHGSGAFVFMCTEVEKLLNNNI